MPTVNLELKTPSELLDEITRLRRCISMAMGCLSPHSQRPDERLGWYRLLDAIEGREPRPQL